MSTHTPGPWSIRGGIVYGPNGERIAAFEGLANARLIAIAPTMLAELKELAELSDDTIDEGDPAILGSFRDSARAIIANAERR